MIKATAISYSYGIDPLFENAHFSVGTNVKAGLVGPNGAGKSTLFKLLTGEDTLITGKIDVSGKISMVPQEVKRDPQLDNAMTIQSYIDPLGKKEDYELDTMLAGLEMEKISLHQKPIQLSGGQKQN